MPVTYYGPVSIRRREIPHFNGVALSWYTQPGGGGQNPLPYYITGRQETVSKRNPLWRVRRDILAQKNPDGSYVSNGRNRQLIKNLDIGGDFFTTTTTYEQTHKSYGANGPSVGNVMNYYSGPLFSKGIQVGPISTIWPVLPSYDTQVFNLLAYGGAAVAATAPTIPVMSLSNALGELLRDGIPHAMGRIIRKEGWSFDSLSKEYLNYEFGWKPLIGDIRKLCKAVLQSKRITDQYLRDSGKPIARSHTFPTLTTVTSTSESSIVLSPPLPTGIYANNGLGALGVRKLEERSVTEFWFEGVYSYFLELGDDSVSKLDRTVALAEKLLGLELTAEVLWNLTPWTWLIDWFVNIGDVITNASAFMKDGLVMRRGYVMCHTHVTRTYRHSGATFKSGFTGPVTQVFGSESKLRKRASPWGFGLTPGVFTPRQWAILAALGISRSSIGQ